jgi:hypothetical protein
VEEIFGKSSNENAKNDARKNYQYAKLSLWVIDLPVLFSVIICIAIEHGLMKHHLITGVSPSIKNLFSSIGGNAPPDEIYRKTSDEFRKIFVSGFATGAISLHVLMSQFIFLVLNMEFLNREPGAKSSLPSDVTALDPAPLGHPQQPVVSPDQKSTD